VWWMQVPLAHSVYPIRPMATLAPVLDTEYVTFLNVMCFAESCEVSFCALALHADWSLGCASEHRAPKFPP